MIEEKLRLFLEREGFDTLIETFNEHEITLATLPELMQDQFLSNLIPQFGKRALFKTKIKQLLEEIALHEIIENPENNPLNVTPSSACQSNVISFPLNFDEAAIYDVQSVSDAASISTVPAVFRPVVNSVLSVSTPCSTSCSTPTISDNLSEGGNKRKLFTTSLEEFNLEELLTSTCIGKAILNLYNIRGHLDSICQGHLVDIISTYFLNRDYERLTNTHFDILGDKIVTLFPKEIKEAYYTPPIRKRQSRDKKPGIAKGKLVDKYRNKLTFLRKAKILPSRLSLEEEDSAILDNDNNTEEEISITWLKNNQEPWNEVVIHWQKTFNVRQKQYQADVTLADIYEEWPVLNTPLGYNLIDTDFEKQFPEIGKLLYASWEPVLLKLADLRRHCLNETDRLLLDVVSAPSVNKEYKHYLLLTLLASLLPSRTKHTKKGKFQWKPTTSECREGVIVRVELPADVQTAIDLKNSKMQKYDLMVQPFIIVEGNGTNINLVYICINNTLYTVPSILKAIDVCFRCYHVFNLRYPFESEHIWLFIQLALYKLKTKFDVPIPNLVDIVNKVTVTSD